MVLFLSVILLASFLTMNPSEKKGEKIPMLRNYYTPDHYPSFQEINHTLHQIAKEHPDIAKVFSIGHMWGWDPATGKYDWPKPLWTIKISDNPNVNESESRVYIHWHHAREWIAPAFMMYLINSLINGYYENDTIHWLVNHYEIYITPLSNADGYVIDGNGNLNNLTGGWGPGGSSEWVYGELNKIGIAVEMEPQDASWSDDGFHPSTDRIQMYSQDLYEAMIYFIEISDTRINSKPPPAPR